MVKALQFKRLACQSLSRLLRSDGGQFLPLHFLKFLDCNIFGYEKFQTKREAERALVHKALEYVDLVGYDGTYLAAGESCKIRPSFAR